MIDVYIFVSLFTGSMTSSALISESSGPPLNTEFPQFTESSIANVTVFQGREATLTCSVKDLGNYRVSILILFSHRQEDE